MIVDTTAMEKNIMYPTDSELLNKARIKLVQLAQKNGIRLRQNYNRIGRKESIKAPRYAHAKQFKRMKKSIQKLRTFLGRVVRDIERKMTEEQEIIFNNLLDIAKNLLTQTKHSQQKIYSIHERHVYCIAKGKSRKRYEYGNKVSIVVTQESGFILSIDVLTTNMYDGHSLKDALKNAEKNSQITIKEVLVDKGYKGHGIKDKAVYMPSRSKKISPYIKKKMNKRSSIEARISTLKREYKMGLNRLRGQLGDKIHAILCAVAYNFNKLANSLAFATYYLYLLLIYIVKREHSLHYCAVIKI